MTLEKKLAAQLQKLQETKHNQKEIIAEVNLGFLTLGIDADSRLGLLVKALSFNTEQAKQAVHNIVNDLKMDLLNNDENDYYS